MAQPPYPTEIAVEAFVGGDLTAISTQLLVVCTHYPERAREFALDAAVAVASTDQADCKHKEPPPMLDPTLGIEALREAARNHCGTCGKHQADVIAAVRTQAVWQKWKSRSGRKYRNQVTCTDPYHLTVVVTPAQAQRDTTGGCNM